MHRASHVAKQLHCTSSIANPQNNGIRGIQFCLHIADNTLKNSTSIQTHHWVNIWGVAWNTPKSGDLDPHLSSEISSLKSHSTSLIMVRYRIVYISLEQYVWMTFPNVSSSYGYISYLKCNAIVNRYALPSCKVTKYSARCTQAIGGGLHGIKFLQEWWLWPSST